MSPVLLWLFFTLDKVLITFDRLFMVSIIYLALMIIIWLIMGCVIATDNRGEFHGEIFWKITAGFNKHTSKYNILAIVLLSVSIAIKTFLPNTKEAVAIVVVPQVLEYAKNNQQLRKIPDNVLNMANTFMEKKISDWTKSIGLDSTSAPIDTQIAKVGDKIQELKAIKDEAQKVLK